MKSEFSVVIATFGDLDVWGPLSMRALLSVAHQTREAKTVSRVHGATLAEARNQGAREATGAWLIFLDADDQLDPGYIEAMETVVATLGTRRALLKPSTLGVYPDGSTDDHPVMIEARPLLESNHMVIGTAMRRAEFTAVDGFGDMPILEDWDLFIRLQIAGATPIEVPDAIYRVGVWPHSRNNQDPGLHGQYYCAIRDRYAHQVR